MSTDIGGVAALIAVIVLLRTLYVVTQAVADTRRARVNLDPAIRRAAGPLRQAHVARRGQRTLVGRVPLYGAK